ncbi:MAG: AAA family ATPase, partial [Oscillospiraceae bacterium]|nr:AAA family ATPase [Oscillospiraceae bacterium]
MKKIQSLKVTKITLNGFRCHKENVVINADDITLISGDNGKGKSSIAHAISYAFYGVDAFGVQDIDRIMNNQSNTVSVCLEFTNEIGETHTFSRTRKGDKTDLCFDGHKIRQTDVDSMLGDKDTFLSLFNPSYFAEVMGNRAREFLELKLPIVKPDAVLAALSKNDRQTLDGVDLAVPELAIKQNRENVREWSEQSTYINGQISELKKSEREKGTKISDLQAEINRLDGIFNSLKQKQFDGINVDELNMEKCVLDNKLSNNNSAEIKQQLQFLESTLYEAQNRDYQSKFAEHIKESESRLQVLSINYDSLKSRLG